ncbi:hypothetical protein ABZ946_34935 [Streptomyces sp. NPDC046324]|uniref:hypothetical protein n=1 Tax=Streptomyces sp. NPDC046324 TaxID=3154915 RepID=UPI0033C4AB18
MPRNRSCKKCRRSTVPTVVVAVEAGRDVYACADHRAELAAPAGDPVVAVAQYQDLARRR